MILVFFLSFHNSLLWFRVGSFLELRFFFFFFWFYNSKSIIQVLINTIIISEVLEHMFYSIKMANISPFGARKFYSALFGGLSPFLSLVGPVFTLPY